MKKGDIVICVDDSGKSSRNGYLFGLKKDSLYIVTSVRTYGLGKGITVNEISNKFTVRRKGKFLRKQSPPFSIKRFKVVIEHFNVEDKLKKQIAVA